MLKKTFNILIISLLLIYCTSCSNKEKIIKEELFNYYYDFSYYGFTNSDTINLKASNVDTLKDALENNKTCIFVISNPACISCKRTIGIINDIAINHDFYIYVIDPYSKIYPVFEDDDKYKELLNLLKPCIEKEDDFVSPIILVINNGSIESYMAGYDYTDEETLFNEIDSIIGKSKLY